MTVKRRTFLKTLGASTAATLESIAYSAGWLLAQPAVAPKHYAFAPGGTEFEKYGKHYLSSRPNTCLVTTNTRSLQSFIAYLNSPAPQFGTEDCGPQTATDPAHHLRELIITMHTNNKGQMNLPVDSSPGGRKMFWRTSFEDILKAVDTTSIAIRSDLLLDHIPVAELTTRFRIQGCRIGTTPKVLEALKLALGGKVKVTAPNHYDTLWPVEELNGWLEYLLYDFEFTTEYDPAKKKPEVPELREAYKKSAKVAFDAIERGSKESVHPAWTAWYSLNRTRIPDSQWDSWIPASNSVSFEPLEFQERVNGQTTYMTSEASDFTVELERIGPFKCPADASKAASKDPDIRRAFVESVLGADPRFNKATTGYPYYERYGMSGLRAFVNAFNWYAEGYRPSETAKPKKSGVWWGYRRAYHCQIPITTANSKLIYNYVSITSPAESQFHLDALIDDATLFTTV